MYNENTKESLSFMPRPTEILEPNEVPDEQQNCLASEIFQRHRSLVELSTVAVNEKENLDRQENSQSSDTSDDLTVDIENDSQGYLTQNVAAQLEVHTTPTKIPSTDPPACSDPLTPTANLKMLMSVMSPAIRDREEKKRDLFVKIEDTDTSQDVVIEKPNAYSRKDKSLGLTCQRFLAKFPEDSGDKAIEISLDEVSRELKVERRRVYDIVNVLESVEVLSRVAKNRYLWHGKSRIVQTLGKLKALSKNGIFKACQQHGKENIPNTPNQKMKRHYSYGDMPTPSKQLSKEEERWMIKAAIDSTDNCRKDKSLGVLSQKFLIMFLLSKDGVVTLEDAATVLLEDHDDRNVKYKTKVRRLYDIANILSSLNLIEKVHIRGAVGKKPGFKWIGADIGSLPKNPMPLGDVMTFKTKHSLLPDPTLNPTPHERTKHPRILPLPVHYSTVQSNKRLTKSSSCSASFVPRHSSKDAGIKRERSNSSCADGPDGFLVHEFASSPVNVQGLDSSLLSPTEVTFREEIQKLQQKFPDRMSQLLAVLPPYLPSSGSSSSNKTSRRNLFCKNKKNASESNVKRLRKNSDGDFHSVKVDNGNRVDQDTQSAKESAVVTTNENKDPNVCENETKFIHSANSPFKVMSSCAFGQSNQQNLVPANIIRRGCDRSVIGERPQQVFTKEPRQRSSCQWQHMVIRDGANSPMVQLVDQAVSPIPHGKLAPRASIAVQASLIKDISPLKPLVYLHHRLPSPWKPAIRSPSNIPPAPPSTPELPSETGVGPFQSQSSRMFLRSVSPYPLSASQGSSPVGLFNGSRLFFPPSPKVPSPNTLSEGNLLFGVNQGAVMNLASSMPTQSNSCPPSVNPSPNPDLPSVQPPPAPSPCNAPVRMPLQSLEHFDQPANSQMPATSSLDGSQIHVPVELPLVRKQPCMLMNGGYPGQTLSSSINAASSETVSRK